MKISEIITDKYKLRIPPTVYYDLLADVQEVEEEQEPTTKNDLGVDCISRAEMLRYQEYLHGKMPNVENYKLWKFIKDMPSVTPQEPCDKCEVGNPCLYCKHEFEPQESEVEDDRD